MNKLLLPGRIIFSVGIAALGVLCFLFKDFIVGRPPAWPADWHLNPALGYLSALLLIGLAIAIQIKQYAAEAALAIGAIIFLLSVCRHLPHFMETWPNAYKAIALVGGCLIVAAACSQAGGSPLPRVFNNRAVVFTGTLLLAIFLVVCGYSHFKYAAFVDTLIPDYIPLHRFWTYGCGICLLAGGVGLLLPRTVSIAALLCGIMIAGWFLLLHVPRFLANTSDPSDRMGLCESFTFCGIFFLLAAHTSKKNK